MYTTVTGEHTHLLVGYSKKRVFGQIISKVFFVGGHHLVLVLQVASNSLAAGGRSCLLGTQQQRSELERIAASYASVFVAVVGESEGALGVPEKNAGERFWRSRINLTLIDQSGIGNHITQGTIDPVKMRCPTFDLTAADLQNYPEYVTSNCSGFRNFVKLSQLEAQVDSPRYILNDTLVLKCTVDLLIPFKYDLSPLFRTPNGLELQTAEDVPHLFQYQNLPVASGQVKPRHPYELVSGDANALMTLQMRSRALERDFLVGADLVRRATTESSDNFSDSESSSSDPVITDRLKLNLTTKMAKR